MTCSIHRAFCLSGWLLILLSLGTLKAARAQPAPETVAALRNLSAEVLSKEFREKFKDQTWRALRERGDVANRLNVANWRKIKNLKDWETLREDKLQRLRAALGEVPVGSKNSAELEVVLCTAVAAA